MADDAMNKIMTMARNGLRPDKHTQRKQWNASWEQDLNDAYKTAMQPRRRPKMVSSPELKKLIRDTLQQSLLAQEKTLQSIIQLQKDTVNYASVKHRFEDVAASWRGVDEAARRDIVLEAFYNVSLAGPDMEGHRKWCPDMTLANICRNNGQLFLQSLSLLIEHWATSPALPVLFPNAMVDRVNEELDVDTMVKNNKISRAYFVSFVIWRILLQLYDDDESYLVAKAPKQAGSKRAIRDLLRAKTKQGEGDEYRAMLQETSERFDKLAAEQVKVCWTCGKDATRSKSGGPLKLCQKCNTIGRQVWYCSTDCQKEDWKKGQPRPHRVLCGKPLEPSMFQEPVTEQTPVSNSTSRLDQQVDGVEANYRPQTSVMQNLPNISEEDGQLQTMRGTITADPPAPTAATRAPRRMILATALLAGAAAAYSFF